MASDATKVWGPTVLPGGKWYLYKGEQLPIPLEWKSVEKMMDHLKYVEQMEWAFALPEQQQALFNKKLEILTRDLPVNWTVVVCTIASGVIIFVAIVSTVKS